MANSGLKLTETSLRSAFAAELCYVGQTTNRAQRTMSFNFVGYFPKRLEPATEAMGLPGVAEIWSVADCISAGPENWIKFWRHDDFGAYNTSELARSVVPADGRHEFVIVAYRLWSEEFDEIGSRAVPNCHQRRDRGPVPPRSPVTRDPPGGASAHGRLSARSTRTKVDRTPREADGRSHAALVGSGFRVSFGSPFR